MFGSCRLLNYGRHAVEVAVHRAGGGKLFSLLFTPDRHKLKSPASSEERENNAATFLYASIAFLREFFASSLVHFSLFLRYSIMNESLRLCCSIFAFLAELQVFFGPHSSRIVGREVESLFRRRRRRGRQKRSALNCKRETTTENCSFRFGRSCR